MWVSSVHPLSLETATMARASMTKASFRPEDLMEMQEAFNLYVIPGKSHVLSRGNSTLQNGSSFCPNSAMDFAGTRSNCVSPLSILCTCTRRRSGHIDADVGLSSD